MKTVDYLDACKAKLGIESDYRLAKELGLRPSAISAYRNAGGTFSKRTAMKVAKILGVHHLTVRADAQVERAKSPEARALLRALAAKIMAVLVCAGAGGLLTSAGGKGAHAGGFDISNAHVPPLEHERAVIHIAFRALAWLAVLFAPRWAAA